MLHDLGVLPAAAEPFQKLFHQGLLTAFAYQRQDGSLVPNDLVHDTDDDIVIETATGDPVTQVVAKMSKSLKNVVTPDDIIAEFGADTFRLYEMYMGPLEASKPWNPRDIIGSFRFLQRVWRLAIDEESGELQTTDVTDDSLERLLHRTIAKVGRDIERLAFNTAIAALIEFINAATALGGATRDQLERFTLILAPMAPHMAEELWSRLGHGDSLARHPWPEFDEAMLVDESIEYPVQVMGKVRGHITVARDLPVEEIEAAALSQDAVAAYLEGKTIRKVIVVPGRIVNIVAN
jgi:leucyl-tRNA synthetase